MLGLLTVGPTLNYHYNIGINESLVTYHTTISVGVSHEWAPVFEVLGLIGRQRHHSDVGNHVFVGEIVINELRFVGSVEHVEELGSLPNGISTQNKVLLVLSPVNIAH